MSTHTPGPWGFVGNSLVGPKIDDKPIWLRPVILRSEVGVRQSDARLIANAPELLAALQMALESLDKTDIPQEWDCRVTVRAAIAKVTGAAA